MPNPPAAGSYYRTFSSTQPVSAALPKGNAPVKITKGRKKRKGKLGERVAIPSEGTKKRKRKVTKEQAQEQRRMSQQDQQGREDQERQMQILQMELEAQQITLRRQLVEQQKQEQARKEREEREFHTHQRRFVQQQRLQEGQHTWKLEWQRQQPHLQELLRTEELFFQAQETLRQRDIPLSDLVNGENLHDFAQPN